jgi:hypothetical protein
MHQTLLAILALSIATLFVFNSQQHFIVTQQRYMTQEIYEIGSAIAVEAMEVIGNQSYDADGSFGNGRACEQFHKGSGSGGGLLEVPGGPVICDDVDDFHNMPTAVRSFEVNGKSFNFTVDVEVTTYTDDGELGKKVKVSVQDYWNGETLFLKEPITLSRGFFDED